MFLEVVSMSIFYGTMPPKVLDKVLEQYLELKCLNGNNQGHLGVLENTSSEKSEMFPFEFYPVHTVFHIRQLFQIPIVTDSLDIPKCPSVSSFPASLIVYDFTRAYD